MGSFSLSLIRDKKLYSDMYIMERYVLVFTNLIQNVVPVIYVSRGDTLNACKYYVYFYRVSFISSTYSYFQVLRRSHNPIWTSRAASSLYVMLVIFTVTTVNDAVTIITRVLVMIVLYINVLYCCVIYFYRESICDIMKNFKNSDNNHNEVIVYLTALCVCILFCIPLVGYIAFGDKDNASYEWFTYHFVAIQIYFTMFMTCYTIVPRALLSLANDKVVFLKRNLRRFSNEVKTPVENAQKALALARQSKLQLEKLVELVPIDKGNVIIEAMRNVEIAANGVDVASFILDDAMEVYTLRNIDDFSRYI